MTDYMIREHWLTGVRHLPSDNCQARQDDDVSLLVIHYISLPDGEFGGPYIDQLFCNQLDCNAHASFHSLDGLKVSSHLLIDRFGQLTQFVPFNRAAWHAGVSSFQGRKHCNEYSIGIELEGDERVPFTDAQYQSLVNVTKQLMIDYPLITLPRICGHSDIAPDRKTDPGPLFDWNRYRSALTDSVGL